jgi:UPF0042 nucleotide-binding protein
MLVVIVSGLSGSGKSVALNVLEDASFYCVDNLPATLLTDTVAFLQSGGYERIAMSVDARSGPALDALPRAVEAMKALGADVRLLFLDAKNDTLIKRFSETRRRHPLAGKNLTLDESITHERELLEPIGEIGHHIDTSDISANTLRSWVKDLVEIDRSGMTLLFESFGFKQGIPLDADMVFDVRCLPNPFYDRQLRLLTGLDAEVIAFLDALPEARRMETDIGDFIGRWLPAFQRDNRAYLTVAVGCTGGQHRSVYFAERLAVRFRADAPVLVRHRQLARETQG